MYITSIFETAISECGYELYCIHKSGSYVRKAEGSIPIVKRVSINGIRRKIIRHKRVLWNDLGQCFSRYSPRRLRQYDLPLSTVYENFLRKETRSCM